MKNVVVNIHERVYEAPAAEAAALVATLASKGDHLWPHESWPRMQFDQGLLPGAHIAVGYSQGSGILDEQGRVCIMRTLALGNSVPAGTML